jgi:hypothetical protein
MKLVLAVVIALVVLYLVFRSEPVETEIQRSTEVSEAVDAPEQVARKNYLKDPIDRTKAVLDQVEKRRDDSEF